MSAIQKQRIKMNMARMKDMHKKRMQAMKDRLDSMPETKKEERDLIGKYMPEDHCTPKMSKKDKEERDEKVERMRQQQTKVMELNKYTLARYQIKAAPDLATRSMDQGSGIEGMRTAANRRKIVNRSVGIGRAANKLTQKTNEDVTLKKVAGELEAASKKHLKQAQKVKAHVDKMEEENIMEDGHQDVASARRKAVLIMEDAAQLLMKLKNMDPMESLPSWWMNKMAVTAAYMDSMRNYLLVPSQMPSPEMETESYSMASSDTNPGMKRRKAPVMVATTPVSEKKEKKKKDKLIPTGPFVSFGTGSYTDSGNGASEAVDYKMLKKPMGRKGVPKVRASGGLPKNMFKTKDAFKDPRDVKEDDQEKMKNIDSMMKMYKDRKPLSATVKMGQGMKRLKSKLDAIPSTDKAGRVSRSRIQKKFGSNVLQN